MTGLVDSFLPEEEAIYGNDRQLHLMQRIAEITGMRVTPSMSNFILVHVNTKAEQVDRLLQSSNIFTGSGQPNNHVEAGSRIDQPLFIGPAIDGDNAIQIYLSNHSNVQILQAAATLAGKEYQPTPEDALIPETAELGATTQNLLNVLAYYTIEVGNKNGKRRNDRFDYALTLKPEHMDEKESLLITHAELLATKFSTETTRYRGLGRLEIDSPAKKVAEVLKNKISKRFTALKDFRVERAGSGSVGDYVLIPNQEIENKKDLIATALKAIEASYLDDHVYWGEHLGTIHIISHDRNLNRMIEDRLNVEQQGLKTLAENFRIEKSTRPANGGLKYTLISKVKGRSKLEPLLEKTAASILQQDSIADIKVSPRLARLETCTNNPGLISLFDGLIAQQAKTAPAK